MNFRAMLDTMKRLSVHLKFYSRVHVTDFFVRTGDIMRVSRDAKLMFSLNRARERKSVFDGQRMIDLNLACIQAYIL